jgi:hypothetical protein
MFFHRSLVGLILTSTFVGLFAYAQAACVSVPDPGCGAATQPACPTVASPRTPAAALDAINAAHATEGLPELVLPATYTQASPDQQVIMLINAERVSRNLAPYNNPQSDNDPVLGYTAFNHSSLIAQLPVFWNLTNPAGGGSLVHNNAIDGDIATRISAGIPFTASGRAVGINGWGEIVAANENPEGAMFEWMYDDAASGWGHRHNILNCSFQFAGAGVATAPATAAAFGAATSIFTVDMFSPINGYQMLTVTPGMPKPAGQQLQYSPPPTFDATNNTYGFYLGASLTPAYGVPNYPRWIYIFFPADWGQPNGQDSALGQLPIGSGGTSCAPTLYPPDPQAADPTAMGYSCEMTLPVGTNCANGCSYEIDAVDKFSNTLRVTGTLKR